MQELIVNRDMEPNDVVKYYFAEYGDEEIDDALWNHTCWPFGSLEEIGDDVYLYYLKNRR